VRELPLGIDCSTFNTAHHDHSDALVVGYVGRLAEHKGVHIVIDALSRVPHHVRLRLVGDGPYRAELEQLAQRCGVADRIEWLGHRAQAEVNNLYGTFGLLVVPSQTRPNWIEQFGRVAVEAMASGVPVVVSDSGSLPTVVGEAGVVVPEGDVQAWADTIRTLAEHPERRAALGAAARVRAQQFDWSVIARSHLELYGVVTR
jgi:glycosyltransferase involved in cell wall biosynthesis